MKFIGFLLLITAIVGGLWLVISVMLIGGIEQASENWGVDNSGAAWGVVRAIFCELGFIPACFAGIIGLAMMNDHNRVL